jgi:hypothetical protein
MTSVHDPSKEEALSREARAFLERPVFTGALWLGAGLLALILSLAVASFFVKAGAEGRTVAASISRMFLKR